MHESDATVIRLRVEVSVSTTPGLCRQSQLIGSESSQSGQLQVPHYLKQISARVALTVSTSTLGCEVLKI
jgi:hypothetical protein